MKSRAQGGRWSGGFGMILVMLLTGCLTGPYREAGTVNSGPAGRSDGYALLHELLSSEKDVSKLLLIKRDKSDVHAVIKGISDTAGAASKQLEAIAKQDSSINLKVNSLPAIEQKTRASIESARTKQLLGSSKRKFELNLLLSQAEALSYGTHLARTLALEEAAGPRHDYLNQLSRQLDALYLQVLNLIGSRYVRDF